MGYRQRAVLTMGRASYFYVGDAEANAERFFTLDAGKRVGCALPVLLQEGWSVVSVTRLERQAQPDDDYGSALVVLTKEM